MDSSKLAFKFFLENPAALKPGEVVPVFHNFIQTHSIPDHLLIDVADYEHVLELQSSYFNTLGDHPKGELLFGLAEGYSRLGQQDKARLYFERLVKDAPASGQTPKAKQWLADGTLPKNQGLGCVGCHK